jgi:hypothetical protein
LRKSKRSEGKGGMGIEEKGKLGSMMLHFFKKDCMPRDIT